MMIVNHEIDKAKKADEKSIPTACIIIGNSPLYLTRGPVTFLSKAGMKRNAT